MNSFEQWWDSVEWSFSMRLIIKPLVEPFAKMAWNVALLKEREDCAERAWIALVKNSQPWNVRRDVTESIKAGTQK